MAYIEVWDAVSYDPETGEFFWVHPYRKSLVGKLAGHLDKGGYYVVKYGNIPYKAGRLAWKIMTGEWPTHEIDHRNRTPSDNSWENIRDIPHWLNCLNRVREVPYARNAYGQFVGS